MRQQGANETEHLRAYPFGDFPHMGKPLPTILYTNYTIDVTILTRQKCYRSLAAEAIIIVIYAEVLYI